VKAYKRFVDITREEGVNNVAFVWHSYAAQPYNGYALASWYPGDDYVDWMAGPLDWQDARLQNNETVAEAWFMETAKDRYLKQSPQLFEQLGFTP
jgi:beta-mannanase